MAAPTIFVPFINLSFNSGKLNSSGLVEADGVVHNGAGYLAGPPLFRPHDSAGFTALSDAADDPIFGHVNLNKANSASASIYLYCQKVLSYIDITGDPPWSIVSASPIATAVGENEGSLVSFGPNEIFVAGHSTPALVRLDGSAGWTGLFTSADKPQPAFASAIGARLLFGNIAETGTAGDPDPNRSLVWWGATDNARLVGNPDSLPQDNTDFQPLNDDYGDINGLSNGKRSASIFKSRAVYEMELGGIFGFAFNKISTRYGCLFTRSITELADDDYLWSNGGPAVVRDSQVMLLGDGFWTARGLEMESPPNAEFRFLSAAADDVNGLVFWLLEYKSYPYTYAEVSEVPTETIGTAATTYALLCYNPVSNQFSFVWRQRAAGISIVPEATPSSPATYRPLCLIDRIPWSTKLPMSGVGMLAVAAGGKPQLFLSGLSGSDYTPEFTVGQDATFTTGLIPVQNPSLVTIQGVRPVLRPRRGQAIPEIEVVVKSCISPWETERQSATFTRSANGDARTGWISTTGCANQGFISIELTIKARTAGSPVAYAFLLNEIEGVEIQFASREGNRR